MTLISRMGTIAKSVGIALAVMMIVSSCAREKVEDVLGLQEDYTLASAGDTGLSGTIVFTKEQNGTRISLSLTGADPTKSYSAALNENASIEGGNTVISLGAIPGNTGKLDTVIQQRDNGVATSYTELVNFNGHITIRENGTEGTVVVQADIGGNKLTGNSKTYSVDSVQNAGIKGNFILQERKNGNTLASLTLSGTSILNTYPAYVREGKAPADSGATAGRITITLGDADAKTGRLARNIKQKDDNSAIQFKDLLTYDGYVSIEQKDPLGSIVVAQGNIGQNAP